MQLLTEQVLQSIIDTFSFSFNLNRSVFYKKLYEPKVAISLNEGVNVLETSLKYSEYKPMLDVLDAIVFRSKHNIEDFMDLTAGLDFTNTVDSYDVCLDFDLVNIHKTILECLEKDQINNPKTNVLAHLFGSEGKWNHKRLLAMLGFMMNSQQLSSRKLYDSTHIVESLQNEFSIKDNCVDLISHLGETLHFVQSSIFVRIVDSFIELLVCEDESDAPKIDDFYSITPSLHKLFDPTVDAKIIISIFKKLWFLGEKSIHQGLRTEFKEFIAHLSYHLLDKDNPIIEALIEAGCVSLVHANFDHSDPNFKFLVSKKVVQVYKEVAFPLIRLEYDEASVYMYSCTRNIFETSTLHKDYYFGFLEKNRGGHKLSSSRQNHIPHYYVFVENSRDNIKISETINQHYAISCIRSNDEYLRSFL